ncbi:MAG: nucleoside deaminase [Bacteroidetes bacterium]|nr:nucleoside deaminase [Bacteroidota bacterium]
MNEALKEARLADEEDEIPVGAVIVANNKIIARAHNLTERLTDVTAHAEMQAITSAANAIGGKYLPDCILYVTLEPCVMCAGALAWSQIGTIVFGAADEKKGFTLLDTNILHPKTQVIQGVLAHDSKQLLKNFFIRKRK